MGIILRKASYTHKPVQCAGKFVAVNYAHFGTAYRQIAVRMTLALIYQHAAGTVHRLEHEIAPVYLRKVHVVLVVLPVSGGVP